MNPLLLLALKQLLEVVIPALAPLLIQLIMYWLTKQPQEQFATEAADLLRDISAAHPDWPPSQCREYASAALRTYMRQQERPDLADGPLPGLLVRLAATAVEVPPSEACTQ